MLSNYNRSSIRFLVVILLLLPSLLPLKAQDKKVLRKGDFSKEINDFKRSSLLLFMVETPEKEHLPTIKTTFSNQKIPEKFNDHTVNVAPFIPLEAEAKDQSALISEKLETLNLAKLLVAKWFNRNKQGTFDLELVKQRGLYNASAFDVQVAKQTLRGSAMLEDAGEHLIRNTFVIVNDFKYTNKEEVVSKGKSILNGVGSLLGGQKTRALQASTAVQAADVLAKGYIIKTTSYLYRLVWDEEASALFFGQLWVSAENYDKAIVDAFDQSDAFRLEYIGRQDAWADVQSTKYSSKTPEELIARATVKAANSALARLERKFEVFRTKTPLISVDPIAAKIGTKEGLKKGDRFEVLEQLLQEDGTVEYKSVLEITVDKGQIWDNSYLPEDVPDSDLDYTVFKGNPKKLYPGMLIRFKKNQNLFK